MKELFKKIYSYGFHFFKLNNLKVIQNLYSQCLTQTLSKITFFSYMEGVYVHCIRTISIVTPVAISIAIPIATQGHGSSKN